MNTSERLELASHLTQKLNSFSEIIELPGINSGSAINCLVEQLIDSIRRIEYVHTIMSRSISKHSADPSDKAFDPIRAAIYYKNEENIDESFWLIFLFTHFGKHKTKRWNLLKNVYGKLGESEYWKWSNISQNPVLFQQWLSDNQERVKENGKFGNHRKYVSIDANSPRGTGAAILSYIEWIGGQKSHAIKMNQIKTSCSIDPKELFNCLYKELDKVVQFGRTAKFDYLTMLGKLGLVNIVPDSVFLNGATGPLSGIQLLFTGNSNTKIRFNDPNELISQLENHMGLYFGMQVIEDALCNWQKSPNQYKYFGG